MNAGLDLRAIDELTGGRLGLHDVPCPLCGPMRKPANRRKRTLRIWRLDSDFATFYCAHCLEHGYARDGFAARADSAALERAKREAAERQCVASADRSQKARWLWSKRRPLAGSIGEIYLRQARGYGGPLPVTLGFLPGRGKYPPALIAGFGMPEEPEPGQLTIVDGAMRGVHITRLMPDGSGKAGTPADKIMLGRSTGSPIVLAPANDLLGIGITEGVEDGLSVYEATRLGVWVAGSASRLPTLAAAVPDYIECATIYGHDDEAGQRGARELAAALARRRIEVRLEGITP